jgi:sulfhydrogenase subunit beta (sulfur reductase)
MGKDAKAVVTKEGLDALLTALAEDGFRVIGPTVRTGSIVYDDVAAVSDLPVGWTDRQDAGHYRLAESDDDAVFGFSVGPQSWKQFLHRPRQRLWRARRRDGQVEVQPEPVSDEPLAFIGVRACELRAIAVQDRVLAEGAYADPHYSARREGLFIVAVNCSKAGGTCFCTSMGTGPEVTAGFDVALTEIAAKHERIFIAEAGSPRGEELLARVGAREATMEELAEGAAVVARTARSMGREMPAYDLHDLLLGNLDHVRWDDVADRCLTCGNCTMVCPTCFCTTVEDTSDLLGLESERTQRWDSCFTMDFSHIHGGSVRASPKARYRQWMTHKLATWIDQFGTSGCVGCGRCITWCPVGIDITEEVAAIGDSAEGRD